MTRNEAIAKKMKWDREENASELNALEYPGTTHDYYVSHLLINKMVEDGWSVHFTITKISGVVMYFFQANRYGDELKQSMDEAATFPAAVVELFCRVNGIKE